MTFLRFLVFLALGLWLGAILFFGIAVAPTAFAVLPTHALAGEVVSGCLAKLHTLAFICGGLLLIVFLLSGTIRGRGVSGVAKIVLVLVMLGCTAYGQYGVGKKMLALRNGMGVIDNVLKTDPRRVEFNRLHKYSEAAEHTVFFCGLGVLLLASRRVS
ncbi:MAG TPA: DUF4149 domain-containing protein [candidate division Zixibacteria bacterium]|nr:DUF4149 domain-containing protein [candidate division Zixibacteria bacterium]